MLSPLREWKLVNTVTYQGNPIYRHPSTNELAWEYCEYLLDLPPLVERDVRAGKTGLLA